MLSKYIPKHFIEIYPEIKKNRFVREEGTVMFADLSGFTNLSEKLTAKGKEGSEEISRIINEVFEDLISLVTDGDGSVYKFGGDAVTVFFPEKVSVKDVITTAIEMQTAIKKFDKIETIAGECSIRMKIGIASGISIIGLLGAENKQYFIAGDTLDTACECEHHAEQGEIIVSKEITARLTADKYEKRNGYFKLIIDSIRNETGFKKLKKKSFDQEDVEWFKEFIDRELIVREEAGALEKGELRNCAVIFLNFTGVEYDSAFNYKLLDEFYSLTAATVKKYQGFINKIDMGDKGNKIIALFGAPVSTEKNEEFALRAIQEIKLNKPNSINIRAGVNNGNIYFGVVGASNRREFTVMGTTVNLSARLMASAAENEIVISGKIKERVPEIETGEERRLKLKGVADLFTAYELKVVLETRKSKRFKLIGRKKEQEEYKKVLSNKKAVLINFKAEAGLGKSVLLNKLLEERKKADVCHLVNCLSYTKNNTYYAVKEFIAKFAGVSMIDSNKEKIKKLRILMMRINEEDNTDLYASFLSWTENKLNTSDPGLKDFFSDVSLTIFNKIISEDKAVLYIEDTHWIDSASAEFLRTLLNVLEPDKNPCQIHFVFRPDSLMAPFEENPNSYTIELKNLEYDEGKEFILEKFNLVGIPAKIFEQIYQKTKGNPFFMEEILLELKNDGNLIQVEGSISDDIKSDDEDMSERDKELVRLERSAVKYRIKPSIKTIVIPDNVNDIVLSRIDKLDENSKTILKIASVIGRIFQFDILKQLQNLKEIASQLDIKDSLFDLTKVDLTIFEETSENEYLFKHAITQEVAYETLLFSLRRKYHLRIAQLYEKNYKNNISSAYELLAFHYRHTNDKEKAKYYLLKSAESAKNKFSYKEAIDYLKLFRKYKMTMKEKYESYFTDIEILKVMEKRKEAIEILEKIMSKYMQGDSIYQSAQVKKINVLRRGADFKRAAEEFEKMKLFCTEDIELEGIIDAAASYTYLGDQEKSKKCMKRLEYLNGRTKDKKLNLWANSVSAFWYFRQRKFKETIEIYEKMLSDAGEIDYVNERFIALQGLAAAYGQLGEMTKAESNYEKVYIEAKKIHNYNLLMRAIDGLSKVSYTKGDYKTAEKYIKNGIKLVDKTNRLYYKELLLQSYYNIRLEQKKYDAALTLCEEREIILQKTGDKARMSLLNDNRGDVYFYKKNYDKAVQIYKSNLKFAAEVNNIEMVGHSYGNLANCYAEKGQIDESLKYYQLQLDYSKTHNDIHSEGKALNNLAYTYFDNLKDMVKAEEFALKAKVVFEKIGFKRGLDSVIDLLKSIEENKAKTK
jgi:adenylate cyclase